MAGSGLFGTFGMVPEVTWATFVAPTHFITMEKEGFVAKKGVVQGKALHGGAYLLADRRSVVKKQATGTVSLNLYDRACGLLFKNMLGAVATTAGGSSTYSQVYTPADTTGLSTSIQIGRPMTNNSTYQAFSYEGCKVVDWSLGAKAGELTTFDVTFDAYQEDVAQSYTAASYTNSNVLNAVEASLIIGGTVTTTTGVTSVSGGTTVSLAKDVMIKCKNPVDTDRFFLGSVFKDEQLENNFREISGSATIQFQDLSTVYTAFAADTQVALQLNIQGPVIGGAVHSSFDLIIPAIYWDEDNLPVEGPALIDQKITFTGLDDGTDNPIQITYVTLDATP